MTSYRFPWHVRARDTCLRLAQASIARSIMTTLSFILIYFAFSIGITFFQRKFIKTFHYPLLVVSCHLIIKFALAVCIRQLYTFYTGLPRPTMNLDSYVKCMAVVGIAAGLDVGLSNWSFEYITILLYTMTKSTCIIFILCFSILFGLERARPQLVAIIVLIASGLFMLLFKSTTFHMGGFLLVLTASFLAGFRWTMCQIVMQRNEFGLANPIDMIYHIQPFMLLVILPLTIWFEGIPSFEDGSYLHFNKDGMYMILIGALLAFLMEISEYMLVCHTSGLTFAISGIFKEIFTIVLAVLAGEGEMNLLNALGMIISLSGITLHVYLKFRETAITERANSETQLNLTF